jgi:Tol biopolymer transport system component
MSNLGRSLLRRHLSLVLLASLAPAASGQGVKLNGPLARPIGGDIRDYALSPDGTRVVYVADQESDDVFELYCAKSSGTGTPLKLAGPRVSGGDVAPGSVQIGLRSRRVVFVGDLDTDGVAELYSVPLGGGTVTKLSGAMVAFGNVLGTPGSVQIDAAEKRVVYLADQDTNEFRELYSVPIGGGPVIKLNPSLPGQVRVFRFRISADGTRVVYWANQANDSSGLFSVPIGGGAAAKLSPQGVPNATDEFLIDSRGGRVLFVGELAPHSRQLFVAPLDGHAPAMSLLPSPVVSATGLSLSADGSRIVCTVVQGRPQMLALTSVPIDGSGVAVTLHAVPFPSNRYASIELTPDGHSVLFEAGPSGGTFELLRAPLDGSSAPVALAETQGSGEPSITPNRQLVVFNGFVNGLAGLFGARIDGSSVPYRIAPSSTSRFAITPDGQRVVFAEYLQSVQAQELFSVPILGGSAPVQLNGALPFHGNVDVSSSNPNGFRIGRSGLVAYLADQNADELFELFSVPADGSAVPRRVSGDLPIGSVEGDVKRLALASDGEHAVYLADEEVEYHNQLFSVRPDGHSPPLALHGPLGANERVYDFALTPDGSRVVYVLQKEAQNLFELRVVPIAGGASTLLVAPSSANPRVLAVSDSHLVFRTSAVTSFALFAVPLDGSSTAVPLQTGLSSVRISMLTPDGQRLVYLADTNADYGDEVYSARLDGSAPPARLDGVQIPSGRVENLVLSSDGTRALFVADAFVDNQFELFSVPVDGSAGPVRLNPLLAANRSVSNFRLEVAGAFAFYASNQDDTEKLELFRVPSDGSAPARKVSAPLVRRGNVAVFVPTPDGSRVVYQADQEVDERFELYSAPSDGAGPVRKLNGALGRGDVGGATFLDEAFVDVCSISPDGARVVFRADAETEGKCELYSAPVDGSGPAIKISAPLLANGTVLSAFRFTPDSKGVVYRAFLGRIGFSDPLHFALFHATLDVPEGAKRVSGIGQTFGYGYEVAFAFAVTPDSGRVLYLLDQETPDVVELFLNMLVRPQAATQARRL